MADLPILGVSLRARRYLGANLDGKLRDPVDLIIRCVETALEALPAGLFSTVTAATIPSARATRGFRTRFIDVQCSTVNIRPV
jgi:hypothetical protein